MRNGTNVNLVGKAGYTALTEAAEHGYPDLFSLLMSPRGIQYRSHLKKWTHCAAGSGGERAVRHRNEPDPKGRRSKRYHPQELIAAKANVEFHARGDETALMAAAAYGHLELVKYLVGQNAEINKTLTGDGTALLVAARNGHLPVVRYLLDEGAEVNASVTGDGTALICAARRGQYEVAKLLLEKGADPFQVSPGDEYAMFHARKNGDKKMIRLLREYEDR